MAKNKQDWLKEAKALGLKVTPKDKIADIKAAIAAVNSKQPTVTSQERSVKSQDTAEQTPGSELPAPTMAKAGKRSRKGLEVAEEKVEKEARKRGELKDEAKQSLSKPKKGPAPKTRSRLERQGKRYQAAFAKVDQSKEYNLDEALALAVETSLTKFDAAVELHVRLNVDPKQSDQNIRETVSLPHGNGKTLRVAVFAPTDHHAAATKAGADIVGEKDFLAKLDKAELDFDVLISTPQVMSLLGKYAKLLGPKGLMPNPKSGTVTNKVAEAVAAAKAGRVEFRVDPQGIIHCGVGRVSFGATKLKANAQVVLDAVKAAKPASVKSGYVMSVFVTTSMGPSIKVTL